MPSYKRLDQHDNEIPSSKRGNSAATHVAAPLTLKDTLKYSFGIESSLDIERDDWDYGKIIVKESGKELFRASSIKDVAEFIKSSGKYRDVSSPDTYTLATWGGGSIRFSVVNEKIIEMISVGKDESEIPIEKEKLNRFIPKWMINKMIQLSNQRSSAEAESQVADTLERMFFAESEESERVGKE